MPLRSLLLAVVLAIGLSTTAYAIDPALTRDLTDGKIDNPCKYSSATLQASLDKLTADSRQYAPQTGALLRAALRAHASGACDTPKSTPTPATTPTPAPTAAAATPTATSTTAAGGAAITPPTDPGASTGTKQVVDAPPEPSAPATLAAAAPPAAVDTTLAGAITAKPSNDAPGVLVALLIVLGVLALAALIVAAVRRLGVAEGPLSDARHSWREAAWRFGGGWETFRDWVRAGR